MISHLVVVESMNMWESHLRPQQSLRVDVDVLHSANLKKKELELTSSDTLHVNLMERRSLNLSGSPTSMLSKASLG